MGEGQALEGLTLQQEGWRSDRRKDRPPPSALRPGWARAGPRCSASQSSLPPPSLARSCQSPFLLMQSAPWRLLGRGRGL